MNKKIVLLVCIAVSFVTIVRAAIAPVVTPATPALLYTFNWPDSFNQPQYQMNIRPGALNNAVTDWYNNTVSAYVNYWGGSGAFCPFVGQGEYVSANEGMVRCHYHLTQAQCMGYAAGICSGNSLQLYRANILDSTSNPANPANSPRQTISSYFSSLSDSLFAYRSLLRNWVFAVTVIGIDGNTTGNSSHWIGNIFNSNAAIVKLPDFYTVILAGNISTFASDNSLFPQASNYYTWQYFANTAGLSGEQYPQVGGLGILYRANTKLPALVNPDGSFKGVSDAKIPRTTTGEFYSYTGYVDYYSNKTMQANSYFTASETALSAQGNSSIFSNYLQSLYNGSNDLGSNSSVFNLLNDKTCPHMQLTQSSSAAISSSVLPGLFANEQATSFFVNLFIPSTGTNLATVLPSGFSIAQYVLPLTQTLSFGSGFFLYLPLFMTDPGNPYYPQGWNYANANSVNYVESASNNSSNFDPEKALMSNFYFQLSSTQSIVPLGLK